MLKTCVQTDKCTGMCIDPCAYVPVHRHVNAHIHMSMYASICTCMHIYLPSSIHKFVGTLTLSTIRSWRGTLNKYCLNTRNLNRFFLYIRRAFALVRVSFHQSIYILHMYTYMSNYMSPKCWYIFVCTHANTCANALVRT